VVDFHSEAVRQFVARHLVDIDPLDQRAQAVKLYYAVRDGIFYEIFGTDLGENLSASRVVETGRGFCLHKAILYSAACKTAGVACSILAAPVRNHVSSPSIHALVGGDIFLHWFNEVKIEDRWIRAAPVFNKLTCKIYGIEPLEFDGYTQATDQPYLNNKVMVYLSDPIRFEMPSRQELIDLIGEYHPLMVTDSGYVPTAKHISAMETKQ
jgi:transglutaminase-like putative cysteine protease